MFRCKFCHTDKPDVDEASAHKGLCKQCHSDNTRYRRLKAKPKLDAEDVAFIERYERLCRHNEMVGGYVPKLYYSASVKVVDRCPCCGMFNAPVYPSNPSMCYDCGVLENNYRSLLRQIDKGGTDYMVHITRVSKARDIEKTYKARNIAGLRVPLKYLNRSNERFDFKGIDTAPKYTTVTLNNGSTRKLRNDAVCRTCGCKLTLENWSIGNGNVCKSCMNEYYRARRLKKKD